jgi:hypothetical protein
MPTPFTQRHRRYAGQSNADNNCLLVRANVSTPNVWVHWAMTVAPTSFRITHYINGKYKTKISAHSLVSLSSLTMGRALLSGTSSTSHHLVYRICNLKYTITPHRLLANSIFTHRAAHSYLSRNTFARVFATSSHSLIASQLPFSSILPQRLLIHLPPFPSSSQERRRLT